jgi:hypothetical protein
MSDLSALMKIAPNSGGYMVGQNQGQARATEALRQQELQAIIQSKMQEAQQSQQMNPLLLEKQRLGNQGLVAGLPGIEAESLSKVLGAQATQQTQPSAIESTIATNKGKVRDEKVKDVEGINNFFVSAGSRLNETPPALRMQALVAQMQASGIDPQSPQASTMLQKLSTMDPNQLPGYFQKLAAQTGQMRAQQTPAYHQAMDVAKVGAAERRYATDKQAETSRYTADAATQRAKAVADRKASMAQDMLTGVKSGKVSPDKALVQFEMLAMLEEDPEKAKQYSDMARKLEQVIYNKANAGKAGDPSIINGELGNRPVPTAQMGQGNGPKPGTKENPIKLD